MAETWKLTVRSGSLVQTEPFDALGPALDRLEARVDELASEARRAPTQVFRREIAPVAQVGVRAELTGPGRLRGRVHAGVDVRGDGSAEAYTGRVRREVVDQHMGETAVEALRRALAGEPGAT